MLQKTLLSILLILLLAVPKAKSALDFLNFVNSPRSNGMGGVSVNLIDEQSSFNNPGAYGLLFFDNKVSITLPNSTKYLPELSNKIRLKTYSIGAGLATDNNDNQENKFRYTLALAYSNKTMDYGVYNLTDATGNPTGTFKPIDKSHYITFGIGIDYYVRIGIGYNHKIYKSNLGGLGGDFGGGFESLLFEATGSAHDVGLLIEFPLNRLFDISPPSENSMSLELTPSLAVVQANMGNQVSYFDAAQGDPLPKIRRIGFGLQANLVQNSKALMNLLFVYEKENDLVNDVTRFSRLGLELGYNKSIYARVGKIQDELYDSPDLNTLGFGLSLRGIISIFSGEKNIDEPNGTMEYISQNIDLKIDWSNWSGDNNYADKTKYIKFSVTI